MDYGTPRSVDTFAQQANRNRLQLIMFIKNHMQIADQDELHISRDSAERLEKDSGHLSANGLYIDNKKFKSKKKSKQNDRSSRRKSNKKRPERRDSMLSGDCSSEDSDLSDDAFLAEINSNWGAEESELRQALYF